MSHQTFWKPEKKVKEKKANSLQQHKPKAKKEVPEWKKDILSHHKSNPSKADRAEFPASIVKELIKETESRCQCGCGQESSTTHHVYPRGRGGRGVKTNAMRLNGYCHDRIQTSETELNHWISVYTEMHGDRFWYDEEDWEEYGRKQNAIKSAEAEKKERLVTIKPVVELLTIAAGRSLKAKEIRLLECLDDKEMAVFANMMSDVIGAVQPKQEIPFGYGYFDD